MKPKQLKVLYAIDSLVAGGAERSLAQLAPGLAQHGVKLEVAYLRDRPGLQSELLQAGASLACLAGPGRRIGDVQRLTRHVHRTRPDLVHTTLFDANIAGRLGATAARVPVVSSVVSETYQEDHLSDPQLQRHKVRAAQGVDAATLRLTRRVHAVSQTVAKSVVANLRYPAHRIDVIHRGRDPRLLGQRSTDRREATRRGLGIDDERPLLLAVARHERVKGLDVLIDAMPSILRSHSDTQLLIAGRSGRQTMELIAKIEHLDMADCTIFLGERDDIGDLLCAADVFVLPSRREGFPGSVVEAMALRTPVVSSDIPQLREVVDDSTALLVEVESAEQIAGAILNTLGAPDAAEERSTAAYQHFLDELTIEKTAAATVAFYKRALAQS